MRFLALIACLLASSAASAAVEAFTLDDGRTFIGEYDDAEQRLYTSIGGKPTSMLIAKDAIVERVPYRQAQAKPPAAPAAKLKPVGPAIAGEVAAAPAAPKAMTPEELAAAVRETAYADKLREADALEADGRKAERQAAEARSDAERKRKEARRHWQAFVKRAALEGVPLGPKPKDELIVLPRTSGNNRASVEALARAQQLDEQADGFDAVAAEKRAAAEGARAAAATMPRGK